MQFSIGSVTVLTAWVAVFPGTKAFGNGPSLGSAGSFAVLGGSTVTSRGTSRVTGNVGVSPGGSISGFVSGALSGGEIHRDDALARSAQRDAHSAAAAMASGACTATTLRQPLSPGIYCVTSPLNGRVILDGGPDGVWIFRSEGPLQTFAHSSIVLMNGATAAHVFWQVAGSVTLGARSQFVGTLVAEGDITVAEGAELYGRALSRGAVTLDGNVVTLCCDPITLSNLSPDGIITAVGGTGSVTFTASALPPGWSLSPAGALTRTIVSGGVIFTVTATDAAGCTGSREYVVLSGTTIPTLSEWVLLVLAALLAVTGIRSLP